MTGSRRSGPARRSVGVLVVGLLVAVSLGTGAPALADSEFVKLDSIGLWPWRDVSVTSDGPAPATRHFVSAARFVLRATAASEAGGHLGPSWTGRRRRAVRCPTRCRRGIATARSPSGVTSDHLTLGWRSNAQGVSSFDVEAAPPPDSGLPTRRVAVGSQQTSATVTGVADGTLYRLRVRACGGGACSVYSNPVSSITGLATPGGLTDERVTDSTIDVRWQDRSGHEHSYRVEWRVADGWCCETATLPAGATTYTITGLGVGAAYDVRVRACPEDTDGDHCSGYTPMLRVQMPTELKQFWHGGREDHFLTASAQGESDAAASGYERVVRPSPHGYESSIPAVEGHASAKQYAGMVPLKLFWDPVRGDNFTTATAQGESDARWAGYEFVRVEGYVFAQQQSGTVPLQLFWHPARGDNMTVASSHGISSAQAAGYQFIRDEGFVYPKHEPDGQPLDAWRPAW